jgi:hypothetical protein
MHTHITAAGLAACAIGCAASGALEDRYRPLTPIAQHSEVELIHTMNDIQGEEEVRTASGAYEAFGAYAPWAYDAFVDHGWASQSANTWATGASVRMKASSPIADTLFGSYEAVSSFEWTFMLDERASFILAGSLHADFDMPGDEPVDIYGRVLLTGPGVDLDIQSSDFMSFDHAGTLEAGEYTLVMETYSRSTSTAGGEMSLVGDLDIAPIPAPGAAVVLLIGGLAPVRRRRR